MEAHLNSLIDTVTGQQLLTPNQLAALTATAARAPFAPDLLMADEALWGGFWHFDVIMPGYTFPALELALLRATRLDGHWPEETSSGAFLASLHAVVAHPLVGVWCTLLCNAPLAIFAAPHGDLMTVVWYGLTTECLHAGYRTSASVAHIAGSMPCHSPGFALDATPFPPPDWLSESVADHSVETAPLLAARLDAEILRWRHR